MNNFPKIIKVLPKKPQASTAVRDITPIYATASISLKNKLYPEWTNQAIRLTEPNYPVIVGPAQSERSAEPWLKWKNIIAQKSHFVVWNDIPLFIGKYQSLYRTSVIIPVVYYSNTRQMPTKNILFFQIYNIYNILPIYFFGIWVIIF